MDSRTEIKLLENFVSPDKELGRTCADAGFEQRIAVLKARSEWDEWLAGLGKKKNGRTNKRSLWGASEETLDRLGDQLRSGGEIGPDLERGEGFDEQAGRVDSGICNQRLLAFREEWKTVLADLSGRIVNCKVCGGNRAEEPPPF